MLSILNQRGGTHNSCEDSVWVEESEKYIVGGIFDGCSTGINSHWASQTIAYAFQREALDFKHDVYHSLNNFFIFNILDRLERTCSALNIVDPKTKMLSTCLMFLYNKTERVLEVRCLGDGVYFINDIEHVVDQDNTPDYLGYVIYENLDLKYDFMEKYKSVFYNNVDRFIICSDGIQAIKENQFEQSDVNWQQLLLSPPKSENYLQRMWNILKNKKFTLGDDLTIISYANS